MNGHYTRRLKLAVTSVMIGTATTWVIESAQASSHREAPFITEIPKVDGTDFFMFRSYESGRAGFVTLIADYQPLQDPYGAPFYFMMDPQALYEIHLDNDGDAREDFSFQFRFRHERKNLALSIGGQNVAVPVINIGPIGPNASDTDNLNILESYTVNVIRNNSPVTSTSTITNADTGARRFAKPVDYIGEKTIANYATYADDHIYKINIPGCDRQGKMFVGQRQEPFAVNVGEIFDLVNTNPLGSRDAEQNDLGDKNITSMILEVPISCVTGDDPVIGGWTTASLPRTRVLANNGGARESGNYVQVSRLGSPLVNEIVIGVRDKDRFNASEPINDVRFAKYVTNPILPALLETLFPVTAPTAFPRTDLVQAFLTGLPGLNQPSGVVASEMLRLNTDTAPKPASEQNNLGALGGDSAGFPNGRRPGDDVVDIELRVAMGALLPAANAPSGDLPFTDGVFIDATMFDDRFPYLNDPLPGSPTD